jgi:hypothetical protein
MTACGSDAALLSKPVTPSVDDIKALRGASSDIPQGIHAILQIHG